MTPRPAVSPASSSDIPSVVASPPAVSPLVPRRSRGAIVAFLGIAFGAALAFATTVVISRGTGAEGVGQYFQFVAVFSVAAAVLTFGGDTGLVRFLSADRAVSGGRNVRRILGIAVLPVALVALGVALVLVVASFLPVADALEEYLTGAGLLLGAPLLVLASMLALMLGALRGLGRLVHFTALQNVLLPLLRLAAVAGVLLVAPTADGLLAAWLLPLVIVAGAAFILVRRALPVRSETADVADAAASTDRRTFWGFSSARGVSSILELVLEWIDVVAVAILLGAQAAGVYAVVTRCVRVGQMVDHAVRTVSSPLISASFAVGDSPGTSRIFVLSGRVLVLLAWPFYLLLIVHAPSILALFGDEFTGGVTALRVICCAMLIAVTAGGVQSMLLMGGRSQWQVMNKAMALAVAVALNVTLIPIIGIAGGAVAWAAALLVDSALAAYQVGARMGVRLPVTELRRPALLAVGAFALPLVVLDLVLPPVGAMDLLGTGLAAVVFLGAVFASRRSFGWSPRRVRTGTNEAP